MVEISRKYETVLKQIIHLNSANFNLMLKPIKKRSLKNSYSVKKTLVAQRKVKLQWKAVINLIVEPVNRPLNKLKLYQCEVHSTFYQ